jgi:4-amino-4-deoxy-L-arabinose transferase-like glycosyltransferase
VKALGLIPAIIVILLLRVALRLGIDYWDGYEYLSNALYLAGKGTQYSNVRPPLVSILNALPLLMRRDSFIAPHLIALGLSILALIALYYLLRLTFDSGLSLLGVALLSLNPLFIHYSVFVMSDIPGMLFLTLGFYFYLKTPKSTLGFLCAAISRYSNLLAFGGLVLFEL